MKKATTYYQAVASFALSHKDSNLIKQNQNLLCYHYTMGQSYALFTMYNVQFGNCGCKGNVFLRHYQIFRYFLYYFTVIR